VSNIIVNPYSYHTAPLVLDSFPNAAAAYSMRKLSINYTGSALRVRRSNDNAEQDIGFDGSGNLNESALTTFTGANNGFVTKWYDQTGNGYDAIQTTTGNQPRIVSSGTVDKLNSKPVMGNVITGHLYIDNSNILRNVGHGEVYLVGKALNDNVKVFWYCTTSLSEGVPRLLLSNNITVANRFRLSVRRLDGDATGAFSSDTAHGENQALICGVIAYSTGAGLMRQNGVQVGSSATLSTAGNTSDTNSLKVWFGGRASGNDTFLQEIIVYRTNKADDRTFIEQNINSYFSIY